jgi:iron-sulfur cluster repair protein YtfE (RIC family)
MSHCRCGCGHDATTADTTVEEIKQRAGALDVLQRFGINHCCGAALPLREAAAAAGVHVEDVLQALASAGGRA